MNTEKILILDFGGQYNQLIARRVRENNIYCEVLPVDKITSAEDIKGYKGVIFTGGPASVYEEGAPTVPQALLQQGIPVLGICYGAQLMTKVLGGIVERAEKKEFGRLPVSVTAPSKLFKDVDNQTICLMSHMDFISTPPEGFEIIAQTGDCPVAAMSCEAKGLYGVQFHPEVTDTDQGALMLKNFLYEICGCQGLWKMSEYVKDTIENIRKQVGDRKVLCAMSGGVDSSVAAVMVHQAIGKQLTCVFVDHGLMRKNEGDEVETVFRKQFDMNLIRVNAQDRFLSKLEGVTDPETKRVIIGTEFIRVFEEEARKLGGDIDFLVQGTIYPDVIESGSGGGNAAVIKKHHNVGGLPEDLKFELIEPLRDLFKDEVRRAGLELNIPEDLVWRQPFPGPGLGVRVIGAITKDRLDKLREADAIFREEVKNFNLHKEINQYFAVMSGVYSVGVMGDERTYDEMIALRAVVTTDFMTANWARLPHDLLATVSNRIVNEVKGINRITYDITGKPPATIEWE